MNPHINVTPLIDVLLVLLIIFMVVTPLKPGVLEARVPSGRTVDPPIRKPQHLVVRINSDFTISLDGTAESETFTSTRSLAGRVKEFFAAKRKDLPPGQTFERTIFVKAPHRFGYGKVVTVIDALKVAGAEPIGLQIDGIE